MIWLTGAAGMGDAGAAAAAAMGSAMDGRQCSGCENING